MSLLNQEVAAAFVDQLGRSGLRHVCVSPGSRSGPLAIAFARNGRMRTWVHVDERCAGFFALGIAKRTGEPAAVLTTSGTAAAELHPAVLEAYHSRTPLLVLTADRPPEVRDRGANQTIDQAHLYGGATRWTYEPGPPDPSLPLHFWQQLAARGLAVARGPVAGPVHLNLPFREPLLSPAGPQVHTAPMRSVRELRVHPGIRAPSAHTLDTLASLLTGAQRPFVHAGTMPPDIDVSAALEALASRASLVIHAEPQSHLRHSNLNGLLRNTEGLLRDEPFASSHAPDIVVRLGSAPTSRTLNEWLSAFTPHVLLFDPDGEWQDPQNLATEAVHCDIAPTIRGVCARVAPSSAAKDWQRDWLDADQRAGTAINTELERQPVFEAQIVRVLSSHLPDKATVAIGSSMPIRDADWFWLPGEHRRFIVNRGVSGIDGFVSTTLGAAAASSGEPTVAICGDLTFYHDMNGLRASKHDGVSAVFVVLNNDGGGIFSLLPEAQHADVFDEVFTTPLGLDLARVAALYECSYSAVDGVAALQPAVRDALAAGRTAIVDVRFSRAASVAGHRAVWAAAADAIREAHREARQT